MSVHRNNDEEREARATGVLERLRATSRTPQSGKAPLGKKKRERKRPKKRRRS